MMRYKDKKEQGDVVVEATIILPIAIISLVYLHLYLPKGIASIST